MTGPLLPASSVSRVVPLASRGLAASRPKLEDRPVRIPAVSSPVSRQFPPAMFDPTPPTTPLTLPLQLHRAPARGRRVLLPIALGLAVLAVVVPYAVVIWGAIP